MRCTGISKTMQDERSESKTAPLFGKMVSLCGERSTKTTFDKGGITGKQLVMLITIMSVLALIYCLVLRYGLEYVLTILNEIG